MITPSNQAKLNQVYQAGEDKSTYKQDVMIGDKKYTVTIRYSSEVDLTKAEKDMAARIEKMVDLATELGLGKEGLQKIQVTNTGVFGDWKGEPPQQNIKEKLKREREEIKKLPEGANGKAERLAKIERQLNVTNKTVDIFNKLISQKPITTNESEPTIQIQEKEDKIESSKFTPQKIKEIKLEARVIIDDLKTKKSKLRKESNNKITPEICKLIIKISKLEEKIRHIEDFEKRIKSTEKSLEQGNKLSDTNLFAWRKEMLVECTKDLQKIILKIEAETITKDINILKNKLAELQSTKSKEEETTLPERELMLEIDQKETVLKRIFWIEAQENDIEFIQNKHVDEKRPISKNELELIATKKRANDELTKDTKEIIDVIKSPSKPVVQDPVLAKRLKMVEEYRVKQMQIKHKYRNLFDNVDISSPLIDPKRNSNRPMNVDKCDLNPQEKNFAEEMGAERLVNEQEWFTRGDINLYIEFYQFQTKYPNVNFDNFSAVHGSTKDCRAIEITPENLASKLNPNDPRDVAIPMKIQGNHWVFVYIDRKNGKVEFYDSLAGQKHYKGLDKALNDAAAKLGQPSYKVEYKIDENKRLQNDSHNCGPWSMYFLENRLKNEKVDFNLLKPNAAAEVIKNYRNHIVRGNLRDKHRYL